VVFILYLLKILCVGGAAATWFSIISLLKGLSVGDTEPIRRGVFRSYASDRTFKVRSSAQRPGQGFGTH
jgi:hypothetical protein